MSPDPRIVDRIVASVLDQLQWPAKTVRTDLPATTTTSTIHLPPTSLEPRREKLPTDVGQRAASVNTAKSAEPATERPLPSQATSQASVAVVSASPAPSTTLTATPTAVTVSQPVVTAADLERLRIPAGSRLLVARGTVLTPTAHDWLRQHRLEWQRTTQTADGGSLICRWQFVSAASAPTIRGLWDHLVQAYPHWNLQEVGAPLETVELARKVLLAGEADRVLVLSRQCELLACSANRAAEIRAVVVNAASQLPALEQDLAPNLLLVDPTTRSLMELRQLVRACSQMGLATIPAWAVSAGDTP